MFILTLKFGYIAVIIEESKNLDEMKVEELQGYWWHMSSG